MIAILIVAVVFFAIAVGAWTIRKGRPRQPTATGSATASGAGTWRYVERASWVAGIVAAGVALAVLVFQDEGEDEGDTEADADAQDEHGPGSVVVERDSYRLVPSGFIDTNDEDKVDLDTARPGYGSASVQVGPSREGGPAELILEDDRVHSGHENVGYVPLPGSAPTYDECIDAVGNQRRLVREISLDDLQVGSALCVRTNDGNIAGVRVRELRRHDVEMVVAFTTWRP